MYLVLRLSLSCRDGERVVSAFDAVDPAPAREIGEGREELVWSPENVARALHDQDGNSNRAQASPPRRIRLTDRVQRIPEHDHSSEVGYLFAARRGDAAGDATAERLAADEEAVLRTALTCCDDGCTTALFEHVGPIVVAPTVLGERKVVRDHEHAALGDTGCVVDDEVVVLSRPRPVAEQERESERLGRRIDVSSELLPIGIEVESLGHGRSGSRHRATRSPCEPSARWRDDCSSTEKETRP